MIYEEFEYLLYDKDEVFKKKMYSVVSAQVQYSSLGRLKQSATITIVEDETEIDYLNDQIQIICYIDNVAYPVGRFLISSPRREINAGVAVRVCECYSKLLILEEDKSETRKYLTAGTNIIAEIKRLMPTWGDYDIPDHSGVAPTDREWEIGTPALTFINDLLMMVNFTGIRTDANGIFVSGPYVAPPDRIADVTYMDDEASILYNELTENIDIFNIPNVIVRYTNNPEISPPLIATYENNSNSSPTSISARGRRIINAAEVNEVVNLQTLQDITKKHAYELTDKYAHVEFSTAINPIHGYLTCIYLRCFDISDKFIETAWSIDCQTGGRMTHVARKVVQI